MAQSATKAVHFASIVSDPTADAPPLPRAYVVEEDRDARVSLSIQLRELGAISTPFMELGDFLDAAPALQLGCLFMGIDSLRREAHQLRTENAYRVVGWPIVVFHGAVSAELLIEAVRLGATDFLRMPCTDDDLIGALLRAAPKLAAQRFREASIKASERLARLTERELAVANGVLNGLSSKEIARRLDLSPRTVEMHRARLIKKAYASSTAELLAILYAARLGEGMAHELEMPVPPPGSAGP